jgi:hypothetical protein
MQQSVLLFDLLDQEAQNLKVPVGVLDFIINTELLWAEGEATSLGTSENAMQLKELCWQWTLSPAV